MDIKTPIIQFKRFRGKINIQRPQLPHYDRALFNAVTNPVIPLPKVTEICYENRLQGKVAKETVDHPYERIIGKEVFNWLTHSKVVGIFHVNSITAEELFKVRVAFHKKNMHYKVYGKSIIRKAVANTKYEAMLPLFESNNGVVFSPEPQVAEMLKIIKKVPQLILMAAIVEDRLMSKSEVVNYVSLPSLQIARSQLVGVLNTAAGSLVNNLQAHQTNLCYSLDAYAQQSNNGDSPTEPTTSNTESK